MATPTVTEPLSTDYGTAFPNSRRVFLEGTRGIRGPVREIGLSGGEPPIRVYDPRGPHGLPVETGLPPIRQPWILDRAVAEVAGRDQALGIPMPAGLTRRILRGNGPVTQLHYARRNEITPEMEFVALREGMTPEFVRSEVARGNSSRW